MRNTFRLRPYRRFLSLLFLLAATLGTSANRELFAAESKSPTAQAADDKAADRARIVEAGVAFLKNAQASDGSFSADSGPGITAIAATAMLRSGLAPTDANVAKALEYLLSFLREDGGIYAEGSRYKNYETSLAIVCFKAANADGKYDKLLGNAETFVKKEQWDEGEAHEASSTNFGGAGYGSHERPDLSNTSFLLDALHELGAGDDDPAIQKALIFVSRCQNLDSPYNTTEFAGKVNDGGFYYTPAAGGSSQAGTTPNGGLRSYGSMTYAGLKSMIYAGVKRDDPRVKAAYEWIQNHYSLDENPGMGEQGLYYYYHTFAKALATVGDAALVDADGKSHDWQAELVQKLASMQKKDGSWLNTNPRWLEGDANLVTSYSLLALSYCDPQKLANASPPVDHIVPPPSSGKKLKR